MIYYFVKLIVNIFYRLYYRLYFVGLDNIPKNKPVILAPNHVNAFVDPIIIGMSVPQHVRFFARGDVFKKPLARWILNKLHISPVFRIQEGYSELKKNDATFEETKRLLSANKTILIFPEAICVQERRLRPFKKGLARIVFQVEESWDFSKEVLVVPIGLNYLSPHKFRSKVFIDVGKPLSVKDYKERYLNDKVRTINDTTKVFENKLAEKLLIIENEANDSMVEQIEEMFALDIIREKKMDEKLLASHYLASETIIAKINHHSIAFPKQTELLRTDLNNYYKLLAKYNLRDKLLRNENIDRMNVRSFIYDGMVIYLGFPIYLIGLFFNYLPFYLAQTFADSKIKSNEFYASVRLNLWMICWIVYFILQLIVIAFFVHKVLMVFYFTSLIIASGLFAIKFYSLKQTVFGRWRLLRMVRKDRSNVESLVKSRNEVVAQLTYLFN
jgi:1-acyl-sn-glycerol-3-phosphate acyltransferase